MERVLGPEHPFTQILTAGNRWGVPADTEGDAARAATLTFKERCSLIEVLKRRHSHARHPVLGLTYSQCVAPANIFVSFAYAADFVELVDALGGFPGGEPPHPLRFSDNLAYGLLKQGGGDAV